MKLTHHYTGRSLLQICKDFGTGPSGFYSTDPWWKNEPFSKETPEAGEYEIILDKNTCGKTYEEQIRMIFTEEDCMCHAHADDNKAPRDPDCKFCYPEKYVTHPAILCEAILTHFKKTGERLLEDWWVRTSSVVSGGRRVCVGDFDADGLVVDNRWGDDRYDLLGLSASARIGPSKSGKLAPVAPLESLPDELTINGVTYKKS